MEIDIEKTLDVIDAVRPKKQEKGGISIVTWLSLLVLAIAVVLFFWNPFPKSHKSFEKFVSDNPQFVLKSATFTKYVMRGTPSGTADKLNKLVVYHVKATGNYVMDMSKLSIEKVDESTNTLYLKYNKEKGDSRFPVSVDVDIASEDIVEIEEIRPEKISEEEASKIASLVSVVAGGVGTYFGGKISNQVEGLFDLGLTGKTVTTALGATTLGSFCAYEGYIMTKNFCLGKSLSSSIDMSDKETLLLAVKELMAMEMLTMNIDDRAGEKELIHAYEEEIQTQLAKVMVQLGYDNTIINFGE